MLAKPDPSNNDGKLVKSIYHDDKFVRKLVKSVNNPVIIDPKNTKITLKLSEDRKKKTHIIWSFFHYCHVYCN